MSLLTMFGRRNSSTASSGVSKPEIGGCSALPTQTVELETDESQAATHVTTDGSREALEELVGVEGGGTRLGLSAPKPSIVEFSSGAEKLTSDYDEGMLSFCAYASLF